MPADGAARTRRPVWWWGATRSSRGVVLAMALLAAATTSAAIPLIPGTRTLHWWLVLPVLGLGTTLSMHRASTAGLHRGSREVRVVPIGQYLFAAGLLLDPVWVVVLAVVVPALRPLPRSIGVRSHRIITMLASSATFWSLVGDQGLRFEDRSGWHLLVALAAAMIVHTLTETVVVTIAVHYTFGAAVRETNIWNPYSFVRDLWEVSIGAIGAVLAVNQPVLTLLVLPIAALAVEHVRLEREASDTRRDARTTLFNVRGFEEVAAHELAHATQGAAALSLVVLDLDNLRHVNNTYGHRAGDAVISVIGRRLQHSARAADVLARVGGDEFVIMLPDANLEAAATIAERARVAIGDHPIDTHAGQVTVTASFGVAQWDGDEPLTTLFDRADTAMYAAKEAGRNKVCTT